MDTNPKFKYGAKDLYLGLFGNVLQYSGIITGVLSLESLAESDRGIVGIIAGAGLYLFGNAFRIIEDTRRTRYLLSELEARLQHPSDKDRK